MTDKYYRVKVKWPVPYFMRDYLEGINNVITIYDSRFYTTATELNQVHLDIQTHLVKNYAEKGLNEAEDFDETRLILPNEEILQLYARTNQPTEYEVEEINDPEQVNLITQALEQKELLTYLRNLVSMGFVPVPSDRGNIMYDLGTVTHDLDRAIAGVLRPFNYEEAFELLTEAVECSFKEIQTLRDYVQTLTSKP